MSESLFPWLKHEIWYEGQELGIWEWKHLAFNILVFKCKIFCKRLEGRGGLLTVHTWPTWWLVKCSGSVRWQEIIPCEATVTKTYLVIVKISVWRGSWAQNYIDTLMEIDQRKKYFQKNLSFLKLEIYRVVNKPHGTGNIFNNKMCPICRWLGLFFLFKNINQLAVELSQ